MTASIDDVAARAGVSPSTVSRVLTGSAPVSTELSGRVLAAVQELDYVPNLVARSLASKSTGMLGLIVPEIKHPFYGVIADAAETEAYKNDYVMLISSSHEDPIRAHAYVKSMVNRWVDGLIYVNVQSEEIASYLRDLPLPVVVMDRSVGLINVPFVGVDNVAVGYEGTRHLLSLGHRRILHLHGPLNFSIARDRLQGYRQALKDSSIEYDPTLCVECDYRIPLGRATVNRVLDNEFDFTAIFGGSDYIAIGAIQAISDHGLRVPEDISVVGIDDISWAAHVTPPLTTVMQPLRQMAVASVELLLKLIQAESPVSNSILLPTRLVIRGSTGPA